MQTANSIHRINRLPVSRFHKTMIALIAVAYFFEFADINTFAATAPELRRVWGLSVPQVGYITSIAFVGMFLGSLVGGWLADKWGRKFALISTTVWFSVFSLLTAAAWDFTSMAVLRFLTSAGLSAMTVIAVIYVNEVFPAKVRGRYLAYAMVIGICGTPVTTFIASFVVPLSDSSWRLVYLWGSLGAILIFGFKALVESPTWLESKGKLTKAEDVLRRMEEQVAATGVSIPDPAPPQEEVRRSENTPLRTLFRKRYIGPLLVLSILWITQTVGFFGYSSWAPTLLADQGFRVEKSIFYVALTTIGAPLGSLLAALITDKFERKWLLVIFGVVIGLCGLLYGLTFNPIMIVVFGFLVNMFERGYTSFAYAYSPELFDTRTRSLGTGISYGIGRLSNALGPLIIAAIYGSSGYSSVFFFIAGTWIFGAIVLALFGRKTRVRPTDQPETTSEELSL
ncbi:MULTISPECIES: MFS transporter [Micrococcaceae]|uniref:MFS transporter n=1 Tax=unclassified Kocuria TaxID=2649579 RepID=UPI001012EB20|nr:MULTISPECIES: MFS transporter [unclassified Kocuria]